MHMTRLDYIRLKKTIINTLYYYYYYWFAAERYPTEHPDVTG